jgi:toxin-antitoxin system PIN domain toxin
VRMVDANLLVYAHVTSFPQHDAARSWLDGMLNGQASFGLPWPSLLAFVRLVSNPRVFEKPEPVEKAWEQVRLWLSSEAAWIPLPTERHADLLHQFLSRSGLRSNHVPDADLATLAMEHGLILCSTDGDFARFDGLRWENPLGGKGQNS